MKFFSKIISAVAALSMVATMAVMPVAHAEGATLKMVATPAADKSYVDVVVSYSGLAEGMKTMGIVVNFDNTLFTYPAVSKSKFVKGQVEGWGTGLDADQKDGGSITFQQQATQIKFAFTTTETDEEYLLHENCDALMNMRFNVTDGASSSVWTDGYTFTFADSTIGSFKTYDNTLATDTTEALVKDAAPVVTKYAVTAGEGIASVDKDEAEEGETVNFVVADAPAGKQLADITVNGTSIGKEATSFVMPAAAATVAATFENIPEPAAVVEFTSNEVTANNAVGFWSKLSAFENAGTVTEAGFVFANVDEVGKDLQTSQIKVADKLGLAETITYEFKNLTGFDQFGLKAMAYVVTEKGTFWSDFFGSLIDIVK